jgi:GNAT superfamily N-acetyltransferase
MIRLKKITLKDIDDFSSLEKEFLRYNDSIGENKHYKVISSSKAKKSDFKKELIKRLSYPGDLFFFFAIDSKTKRPLGYIYSYIVKMPEMFKIGKICYLDKMMVSKTSRGKGVGKLMVKEFFMWSKRKGAKICQLNVSSVNNKTLSIYKKWGFKIDQYRMFKKI